MSTLKAESQLPPVAKWPTNWRCITNCCLIEKASFKAAFEGFKCRQKVLFRGANCSTFYMQGN